MDARIVESACKSHNLAKPWDYLSLYNMELQVLKNRWKNRRSWGPKYQHRSLLSSELRSN